MSSPPTRSTRAGSSPGGPRTGRGPRAPGPRRGKVISEKNTTPIAWQDQKVTAFRSLFLGTKRTLRMLPLRGLPRSTSAAVSVSDIDRRSATDLWAASRTYAALASAVCPIRAAVALAVVKSAHGSASDPGAALEPVRVMASRLAAFRAAVSSGLSLGTRPLLRLLLGL